MKCYVLILYRYFPAYHPKAGEETHFFEKIASGEKIHTIRGNYDLWKKRIDEVNAGKAYISRRYWSGKPYKSQQVEYDKIYRAGIENTEIIHMIDWRSLAHNDGLSVVDFAEWFSRKNMSNLAIIHFTDFRYEI